MSEFGRHLLVLLRAIPDRTIRGNHATAGPMPIRFRGTFRDVPDPRQVESGPEQLKARRVRVRRDSNRR